MGGKPNVLANTGIFLVEYPTDNTRRASPSWRPPKTNSKPTESGPGGRDTYKEACRNEAKSRLLEAKRYLKEKHNIDSAQITLLDGGFRTNWVVEIWLGFRQNRPPQKEPTLNKNQVKIIKNCDPVKLRIRIT